MATESFENKNISYAYDSIHDFFNNFTLREALKEMCGIIKAANGDKVWEKDYPYLLIYFMKKMEELFDAALFIHYSYSTRKQCIVQVATESIHPNLENKTEYVNPNCYISVWDSVPRHLSAAQYNNPYKAIKKIASYKSADKWKKILSEFTEYAFSNCGIDEVYPPYNILNIQKHLLRLIEACHLLEVRSNIKRLKAN